MDKSDIYPFIKDIQRRIRNVNDRLELEVAYEMVDKIIRTQSFYSDVPYFSSEWADVKELVQRKDKESFGYFDRYLDSIKFSGDIGVLQAFNQRSEKTI